MEKLGIENLKKLLFLLVEMGNVGDWIGRHPELGVAKFSKLFDLADEAMAMTGFELESVKQEIKDLDEVERAQLLEALKVKFDIEADDLEAKIEEGLGLIVRLYKDVTDTIAYAKSFNAEDEAVVEAPAE